MEKARKEINRDRERKERKEKKERNEINERCPHEVPKMLLAEMLKLKIYWQKCSKSEKSWCELVVAQ